MYGLKPVPFKLSHYPPANTHMPATASETASQYTEEVYGDRKNILFGDIRLPDECP